MSVLGSTMAGVGTASVDGDDDAGVQEDAIATTPAQPQTQVTVRPTIEIDWKKILTWAGIIAAVGLVGWFVYKRVLNKSLSDVDDLEDTSDCGCGK